ncbi:hypothetical protein [Falsiroseomonas sp. HW251]|uniref:hypothetical protein n=1 Tax=Falsiroseomonas sp. HW251 TaxID=3390998 RepID=UPI003D31FAE3
MGDSLPGPAEPAGPRPAARQPAGPSRLGAALRGVGRFAWRVLVGGAALAGIAAAGLWVFGADAWVRDRFEPDDGGTIFVDGPQVYTRERLVNDRYQEDSWLNGMLDRAREQSFGYSGMRAATMAAMRQAGFGAALGGTGAPAPGGGDQAQRPPAAPGGDQALRPPPQPGDPAALAQGLPDISMTPTFQLQAMRAYREQIRTMLIENQLDDRHDLRGNSLYRLRFDATILPNEGSRASAQIRIRLGQTLFATPPEFITDGARGTVLNWLLNLSPPLRERWESLYGRWLTSLEVRVEEARIGLRRAYDLGRLGPDDYQAMLARLDTEIEAAGRNLTAAATQPQLLSLPPATLATVQGCYDDARRQLERMTDAPRWPAEADIRTLDEFRLLFQQGLPVVKEGNQRVQIEDHSAHPLYRERVATRIAMLQTIQSLGAFCAGPLVAAAPPVQASPDPTAALAPPAPGAEDPRRLTAEDHRRRLLDTLFWPRIYKATTGVEEDMLAAPGDPSALPQPLSLSRYASVLYRPDRSVRAFRFEANQLSLIMVGSEACVVPLGRDQYDEIALPGGRRVFVAKVRRQAIAAGLPEFDLVKHLDRLAARLGTGADCSAQLVPVILPTGLAEFVSAVSRYPDVYSYAITPTEPDELMANRIRSDMVRDFGIQALLGGQGGAGQGRVQAQQAMAELTRFDTANRAVFGFSLRENANTTSFGWRVQPSDRQGTGPVLQPRQLPMTALVSLPAWWDVLDIEVSRSWVDRQGRERPVSTVPLTYPIELPANFEAVDAILFPTADRGPALIDWQISRMAVRPCAPFSVTLIGRRLWRSTVVTLGSQRSSSVVVMPNMNGIIASFDMVEPPSNWNPNQSYFVPLTVWTSQGQARLPRLLEFEAAADRPIPGGACPERPRSPGPPAAPRTPATPAAAATQ